MCNRTLIQWIIGVAAITSGFVLAQDTEPPAPAATAAKPDEKPAQDEKTPANPESAPTAPMPVNPINPAAELLGRLDPNQLASFAQLIDQDWADKPEWAEMAIAVMRGQAMQVGTGWWRSTDKKYGWTWLKRKYDKNSDNIVERDEFEDATPQSKIYFQRIDRDLDGKVSAEDFNFSASQNAGPVAMKSRMTEFLFFRLDTDSNGQVTQDELTAFFERADEEKSSFLTSEDILTALDDGESRQTPVQSSGPSNADLLGMFFNGQLGWFEEGPKLGEAAPDFTLTTHDNSQSITLSQSRDKKPVVLIFGSFT